MRLLQIVRPREEVGWFKHEVFSMACGGGGVRITQKNLSLTACCDAEFHSTGS